MGASVSPADVVQAFDPPEQTIGERLFLETRFAQYFATHINGNVNKPLLQGDPTVNYVQMLSGKALGPFAGQSINCRSCHFVDDVDAGNRTYADFTSRTPVPDRADGHMTTPRNSLNMVDSNIDRPAGLLLHGDGEFANMPALVDSTLTGRNFGWLPTEYDQAEAHIARIIREDDGTGTLAMDYGSLSYATLFLGTSPQIPPDLLLPPQYRIDVSISTDEEVFDGVKQLISGYVQSLTFSRNASGIHDGSPYDKFLAKNNLPTAPAPNETEAAYSQRLLQLINQLQNPQFVTVADGALETHDQQFAFGALELQGLKLFLRQSGSSSAGNVQARPNLLFASLLPGLGFIGLALFGIRRGRHGVLVVAVAGVLCCGLVACGSTNSGSEPQIPVVQAQHIGNCSSCHVAPAFSDFGMHNIGATQEEYDALHGDGTFAVLAIPDYHERQLRSDNYIPPTPANPSATGRFRSPASASDPSLTDLGLWNVYANANYPEPQARLQALLCAQGSSCDPEQVLPLTIGRFKTPTLRDLGHSEPYLHTGRMATIQKVVDFYRHVGILAQAGKLRNADPDIAGISIDDKDETAIVAFLQALNEDYD